MSARTVERRGGQELLHLVVAVGHLVLPVRDDLDFGVRVLGQFRAHLAHRALDVVGQRLQRVPRYFGCRDPTPLNGFFVRLAALSAHI